MPAARSKLEWLASLPEGERTSFLKRCSPAETLALAWDWRFKGRPAQQPPPAAWVWSIWLILTGRGWGKTTTGAQWVRRMVETGTAGRIALVNDTAADVRDVMIEGPAGLLAVCPPWDRPTYEPSKRRVTWRNGAQAIAYAAEAPGLLRGPEHDAAWCDELAKWKNLQHRDPQGGTAWDNLRFGLRIGAHPRCVVTTTPRPIRLLRELLADPTVIVTPGALEDNAVNLAPEYVQEIYTKYAGTRLGRQELSGEVLQDVEGALWARAWFEREGFRVAAAEVERLSSVVVSIDPAATSGPSSNETGIIVAGRTAAGHGVVLADCSLRGTPEGWGRRAVAAYRDFRADRIVAEANTGGEMVTHVLHTVDPAVPVTLVHASRGKRTRAEPIAALYEQGRIHHVGALEVLEDQLVTWVPDAGAESPDRLDAVVWAFTELLLGGAAHHGLPITVDRPSYWRSY